MRNREDQNKQPNEEQLAALTAFKAAFGRTWKQDLLVLWQNGGDSNLEDGHLLRQVRNTFGPSWLLRQKLV